MYDKSLCTADDNSNFKIISFIYTFLMAFLKRDVIDVYELFSVFSYKHNYSLQHEELYIYLTFYEQENYKKLIYRED